VLKKSYDPIYWKYKLARKTTRKISKRPVTPVDEEKEKEIKLRAFPYRTRVNQNTVLSLNSPLFKSWDTGNYPYPVVLPDSERNDLERRNPLNT
jgi:hypothetical protein